jgi:2-amino-4-hydroxy-6-hydroxymethyldihydropteridine diphosphokinase
VTVAYVGIGSNLNEPVRQVQDALLELDHIPLSRVLRRSSLYKSAPLGYADQADFVNAVGALETALEPEKLLDELLGIEARHGRRRSFANAPRSLDLDLLLFGQLELQTERLTIPHPRMHERAFVLKPLLELDGDISVPGKGAARELLKNCDRQFAEKIA